MNYTTQELMLGDFLMFFIYSLAIASLLYYHRKIEYSYLKLGALALCFALISQLLASLAVFADMKWVFVASLVANLLFSVFMYAVLQRIGDQPVSVPAIALAIVTATLLAVAVAELSPLGEPVWVLIEVPGAVLLVMAIGAMLKTYRSPGRVSVSVLLLMHVFFRTAVPFVEHDESLYTTVFFIVSIADLLAGSLLTLVCAEQLMEDLEAQEDQLRRFEQENRRLELQFSQAQKHESLGVLAGGIAHDFNNMLTSVLGYTSLAMRKLPPDSEVRKDLYMVMSGARQAADLTSQMLVYAGKGAIEFESVDLSTVTDNMAGLINSIVPRKIHLSNKISRDLPLIKGDTVQLGQVLMNLVANGVDAIGHEEGTIEIRTGISEFQEELLSQSWFADDHEPGAYVYLTVTDSGVGMDAHHIERIFDPFYSNKQENKGLGLSSISGIVRQHKGFIHINSAPGEGTEFMVCFPVIAYRDVARPVAGNSSTTPRLKGRVLLADDDPRIRSLIASILENDGFAIVDAEDGREAAKQVIQSGATFDLFVLDCTMPKMSGIEVYQQIRGCGLTAPVILISGYYQEQVINDIHKDDNAYFIKKPFSVDELIETANSSISIRMKSTQTSD